MPANSLAINTGPLALPPARVTTATPRKHSGQIKSPLGGQLGPLQEDEPRRGYSVQAEVPFCKSPHVCTSNGHPVSTSPWSSKERIHRKGYWPIQ